MKNKTIAYIRVSTDKQTIENQRNEINNYAIKNKMVIDEFIEVEMSSRKSTRDRKIHETIDKLNKDDILIVSELSRLGRSTIEVLGTIDTLTKNGIKTIFIKQNLIVSNDTEDITSKIMITLFSLFAELERDLISKRTKEALALRKKQGAKLGNPKEFRASKYDDYEETIYQFRENAGLSFEKICLLLDPKKLFKFKAQSLRTWFIKRYIKDEMLNTYQKTKKYIKHLKEELK